MSISAINDCRWSGIYFTAFDIFPAGIYLVNSAQIYRTLPAANISILLFNFCICHAIPPEKRERAFAETGWNGPLRLQSYCTLKGIEYSLIDLMNLYELNPIQVRSHSHLISCGFQFETWSLFETRRHSLITATNRDYERIFVLPWLINTINFDSQANRHCEIMG